MKQNYEMLEISVVYFDNEDIVTTSTVLDNWSGKGADNELAYELFNKK